ncbi:hypothetical protein LXL04_023756 [Taraxacum kok-saghyz]
MTSGRVGQSDRKSVVYWSCGESSQVRSHCLKFMADEGLRGINMAEDDDEDDYDSDEGLLLMYDHHENVGVEKQKMKKCVPGVASGCEAHTNEKVGKMRKLKPCVSGKQKRVSFEGIDSPPKVGELGSSCSGVYDSTFSSSVGGSQIHRSPIASIGRCSGSRSSSRAQKSGSFGKSENQSAESNDSLISLSKNFKNIQEQIKNTQEHSRTLKNNEEHSRTNQEHNCI